MPNIGLNHSQDLASGLSRCFESPRYHLLPSLLIEPTSATAERVLTALGWFVRTFIIVMTTAQFSISQSRSKRFSPFQKSPRPIDLSMRFHCFSGALRGSMSGLSSSTMRALTSHTKARPNVCILRRRSKKVRQPALCNQSHLTYGRQIFQLCAGAVLFGASLSKDAGIADKFVTSEERLQIICKTLDDESLKVADRFTAIAETVTLIDEFRFVEETGPLIRTLVGAVQCAAKNLLLCGSTLDPALRERVEGLANAPRSYDSYEALAALKSLDDLKTALPSDPRSPEAITRRLADVVWHYTYMHYYWLTEQRNNKARQE